MRQALDKKAIEKAIGRIMKIKLIKGWNGNMAGTVLEPPIDGVALTLIERGYAVEIKPKKPRLQEWVKKEENHVENQ